MPIAQLVFFEGISIHTPVKGVTGKAQNVDVPTHNISIHTPVKGVTRYSTQPSASREISIHTPVKGVTIPNGDISS